MAITTIPTPTPAPNDTPYARVVLDNSGEVNMVIIHPLFVTSWRNQLVRVTMQARRFIDDRWAVTAQRAEPVDPHGNLDSSITLGKLGALRNAVQLYKEFLAALADTAKEAPSVRP